LAGSTPLQEVKFKSQWRPLWLKLGSCLGLVVYRVLFFSLFPWEPIGSPSVVVPAQPSPFHEVYWSTADSIGCNHPLGKRSVGNRCHWQI